jgi:hypothetical protein
MIPKYQIGHKTGYKIEYEDQTYFLVNFYNKNTQQRESVLMYQQDNTYKIHYLGNQLYKPKQKSQPMNITPSLESKLYSQRLKSEKVHKRTLDRLVA